MQLTAERDMETVAIIGGGCGGVLVATHLLRADDRPRRIVIFEPCSEIGAGAAYATDDPRHVLNAPAGAMSAFEDEPDHFAMWLADQNPAWGAADFVPRYLYRRYLQDVVRQGLRCAAPGTELSWVREFVTSVQVGDDAGRRVSTVRYGNGRQCQVDSVVLALGAPAPVAVAALDVPPSFGIVRDPWCPGALDGIPSGGDVLVLGTGLTMIDVTVVLTDGDPDRTVHARSRHGLLPAEHTGDGFAPWPEFAIGRPVSAREVLRRLRQMTIEAESDGWNWRNVIAAARSAAPEVWRGLPESERSRLLRHLGRRWEVSRHRMSAPVAAAVRDLRRCGRLTVGAGRVLEMENLGSVGDPRLRVVLSGPAGRQETLQVSGVIDCTGPGPDPTVGSPLVAGLVTDGWARLHPSGIGLDVDDHGDLRDSAGTSGPIHTVGWCRRGAEFEATAVPEIRRQAGCLARRMADTARSSTPVLAHS